jgi:hypothetical protein
MRRKIGWNPFVSEKRTDAGRRRRLAVVWLPRHVGRDPPDEIRTPQPGSHGECSEGHGRRQPACEERRVNSEIPTTTRPPNGGGYGENGMNETNGDPAKPRLRRYVLASFLVDHILRDEGVAGSNPATPTSTCRLSRRRPHRHPHRSPPRASSCRGEGHEWVNTEAHDKRDGRWIDPRSPRGGPNHRCRDSPNEARHCQWAHGTRPSGNTAIDLTRSAFVLCRAEKSIAHSLRQRTHRRERRRDAAR